MIDLTAATPKTATPEWWEFLPQFIDAFNSKLEDPKSLTAQEYRIWMRTLDKFIVVFKNQKHILTDESAGDKTQEEIDELFESLKALRLKVMEFCRTHSKRGQVT